ncbi:MAG: serine/threonine-protein kinase, partial [Planctomycetota bacterium]
MAKDLPSSSSGESDGRDAREVYEDYRKDADDVDIDELCDRHPKLANALRGLHSLALSETDPNDTGGEPSTRTEGGFEAFVGGLAATEDLGDNGERVLEGELKPGELVGEDFRIVGSIGEGGFACVYQAEQIRPVQRTVALKSIKPGLDTRQVLARFDAERQALAVMNHEHIARVFDAGHTELGRPYFVMEFVEGPPITTYCDEHRLSVNDRLRLFISVCEGVQHAHQKAIIHRDLKPSNVLVSLQSDRPTPKIIDFGIAKALSP